MRKLNATPFKAHQFSLKSVNFNNTESFSSHEKKYRSKFTCLTNPKPQLANYQKLKDLKNQSLKCVKVCKERSRIYLHNNYSFVDLNILVPVRARSEQHA